MIRIILTSKRTNQEICYHTCKRLDEAERHAEQVKEYYTGFYDNEAAGIFKEW
jgi:hypothetical protein